MRNYQQKIIGRTTNFKVVQPVVTDPNKSYHQ